MDEKIKYTTVDQQIQKLKSQNLIFANEEFARQQLRLYGYSNLIKSYREPYTVTSSSGEKVFRSGVSFEQILSLYIMDKNIRNTIMASMQDLEEHVKEAAADVLAFSFGISPDEYLQFRNFQNKKKRKPRFSLSGILNTLQNELKTDKDPIHHYSTKHHTVPPWILFKGVYFSTAVNFIGLFKKTEQEAVASKLYDLNKINIPVSDKCKLMMDSLFICIDYRNIAAHGGRIYNYNSSARLRTEEIFPSETIPDFHGLSKLLFVLGLFDYRLPYKRLDLALNDELTRHCSKYPQDITYLSDVLNVNIMSERYVYTSRTSNKYHSDAHCSGLNNPRKIQLNEAIASGYSACKRCIKT